MPSIGSLNLKLVANPRAFFTTLDKVEAKVKKWSNKVEGAVETATKPFRMMRNAVVHVGEKASGLVGAITNPLGAIENSVSGFFQSILDDDSAFGQIDQIARAADKLGAPVQKLSALASVANRNRIETDDFVDVLFSLAQAVGEVSLEIKDEVGNIGEFSGRLKKNALLAKFANKQFEDFGKTVGKVGKMESKVDLSFGLNDVARQAAGARAAFDRLGINALNFGKLDITQQVDKLDEKVAEVFSAKGLAQTPNLIIEFRTCA